MTIPKQSIAKGRQGRRRVKERFANHPSRIPGGVGFPFEERKHGREGVRSEDKGLETRGFIVEMSWTEFQTGPS